MKLLIITLFICINCATFLFGASSDAKLHDNTPEEKDNIPIQSDPFYNLLEEYRKSSWYQQKITLHDGTNQTIEQSLLQAFRPTNGNFPATGSNAILDRIIGYCRTQSNSSMITQKGFSDAASLEGWVEHLNLLEIEKFNTILREHPDFINFNNPEKDDLAKAIMLSGIVWRVKKEKGYLAVNIEATRLFSAMLVPGQPHNNQSYRIYTCMHGFKDKCNDSFDYYFVPYGMQASAIPDMVNFVANIGFPIESFQHFVNSYRSIKDISYANNHLNIAVNLDKDNDLLIACINNSSLSGKTLKDFFEVRYSDHMTAERIPRDKLPLLSEELLITRKTTFNEKTDTIFIIGKAPDENYIFPSDQTKTTSILTHLTSEELWEPLQRSVHNIYPNDESADLGTTLPTIVGMSGGGILHCTWKDTKRICKIVGTLWGNKKHYSHSFQYIETHINKVPSHN
jgi:hypothetical protein